MARRKKSLTFLDTHVVVWLYSGLENQFSQKAKDIINTSTLYVSPLIKLELQYLFEVGKITAHPEPIITSLAQSIGLNVSSSEYGKIIDVAVTYGWTRNPFDRLLVADAHIHNAYFVTKDQTVRENYPLAVW